MWHTSLPVNFKLIVDHTIAVIYTGDKIALSVRMYDLPAG